MNLDGSSVIFRRGLISFLISFLNSFLISFLNSFLNSLLISHLNINCRYAGRNSKNGIGGRTISQRRRKSVLILWEEEEEEEKSFISHIKS